MTRYMHAMSGRRLRSFGSSAGFIMEPFLLREVAFSGVGSTVPMFLGFSGSISVAPNGYVHLNVLHVSASYEAKYYIGFGVARFEPGGMLFPDGTQWLVSGAVSDIAVQIVYDLL